MLIPSTYHDSPGSFMGQRQDMEPEDDGNNGDESGDETTSEMLRSGEFAP